MCSIKQNLYFHSLIAQVMCNMDIFTYAYSDDTATKLAFALSNPCSIHQDILVT